MPVRQMRVVMCWLAVLPVGLLLCAGHACAEEARRTVVRSEYRHTEVPVPDVPARERVDDGYFDRAILAGDSMADGLVLYGLVPEMQLLTRIGLSPRTAATEPLFKNDGEPVTLAKKLPVMRPSAVYLWLGTNGLDTREADRVIDDYSRLLNRLLAELPDTPFFLLEATPVTPLEQARYAGFTNERIDAFNVSLRALARRHNVYVLPVNELLTGEDGFLVDEYAAADGIHLREPAYALLADYLYTHTLPPRPETETEEAAAEASE